MEREGTLHILWMNSAAHNEVPSYHVEFAVGKRSFRAEFPLIAATQIYRRASVIVTASLKVARKEQHESPASN